MTQALSSYPTGPSLRRWLGLGPEPAAISSNPEPTSDERQVFAQTILAHALNHPPENPDEFIDWINELLAMNLPLVVLKLCDLYRERFAQNFSILLIEAAAAMMASDLERTVAVSLSAIECEGHQPAPYVNLVQALLHLGHPNEALKWCERGLHENADHKNLWDLLHVCIEDTQGADAALPALESYSERFGSWVGASLLAELRYPTDSEAKLEILTKHYRQGQRSSEFLIEYTGHLGSSGHYGDIPTVIWQAERIAQTKLPWQLLVHNAQAHLALGDSKASREQWVKLKTYKEVPTEIMEMLESEIDA